MKRAHPESDIQRGIISWAHLNEQNLPPLKNLFAIPNATATSIPYRMRLRAEGLKPGVSDLFLPVARRSYHGLFCEVKTEHGSLSDAQRQWFLAMHEEDYFCATIRSIDEGIKLLTWYCK